MEKIINNPGLQHLAEKVFWNLDCEDLKICAQINQSCKQILENPTFWLKKFKSISMENQKDWIKVIKLAKNSDKRNAIISYLQWNLKKEAYWAAYYGHIDIIKILAPLTDNPNCPNKDGYTPINLAAKNGHTEIVKILAPLTDNPNAPDENGDTPIYLAAHFGHLEFVKFLAPLTDNPNAPNEQGITPIQQAARNGHLEIFNTLSRLATIRK